MPSGHIGDGSCECRALLNIHSSWMHLQGNSDCISRDKDSPVMVAGTLDSHSQDLADIISNFPQASGGHTRLLGMVFIQSPLHLLHTAQVACHKRLQRRRLVSRRVPFAVLGSKASPSAPHELWHCSGVGRMSLMTACSLQLLLPTRSVA